jgi:hypothetical protein
MDRLYRLFATDPKESLIHVDKSLRFIGPRLNLPGDPQWLSTPFRQTSAVK